jgi:hypothetical protein
MSAAAALVVCSCQKIPAPPESPRISSIGKTVARQVVYVCKMVQSVQDVRQIALPFDYSLAVVDSPRLDIGFFDPSGATANVTRSLAKTAASQTAYFAEASRALLQSAGSVPRSMQLAYTLSDSLLDSLKAIDTLLHIRYRPDAGAAGTWDTLYDSLFGRWVPDSLTGTRNLILDSLRRYRIKDSSTVITDIEHWAFGNGMSLSMKRKEQTHRQGDYALYLHAAAVDGDIVHDSLIIKMTDRIMTLGLKRNDTSPGWWSSFDSSALLGYSESILLNTGDKYAVSLIDSTYDFKTPAESQTLHMRTLNDYASGPVDSTSSDYYQRFGSSPAILSYKQTDYYANNNKAASKITRADTSTCTLFVDMVVAAPNRAQTLFGKSDSSHFVYVLNHDGPWSDIAYVSYSRTDYYRAAPALIDHALWTFLPAQAVSLGKWNARGAGDLKVVAYHKASDSTALRVWTISDTGDADKETYSWSSRSHDSLHMQFETPHSGTTTRYRVAGPEILRRSGSVVLEGPNRTIADTAYAVFSSQPLRFMSGTLDAAGAGTIAVTGQDSFELRFASGKVDLVCPANQPIAAGTYSLNDADSLKAFSFADSSLSMTFNYKMCISAEGFINGSFLTNDTIGLQPRCLGLSIWPLYHGSARLYGVFESSGLEDVDDPRQIFASFEINLWGENRLGNNEYVFE